MRNEWLYKGMDGRKQWKQCSGSGGSVINWPPEVGSLLEYFIKEWKKFWKQVQYFIKVNDLIVRYGACLTTHVFDIRKICPQRIRIRIWIRLIRNKLASRIRNSGRTDPRIRTPQKYLRIRNALEKKHFWSLNPDFFYTGSKVKKAPDPGSGSSTLIFFTKKILFTDPACSWRGRRGSHPGCPPPQRSSCQIPKHLISSSAVFTQKVGGTGTLNEDET